MEKRSGRRPGREDGKDRLRFVREEMRRRQRARKRAARRAAALRTAQGESNRASASREAQRGRDAAAWGMSRERTGAGREGTYEKRIPRSAASGGPGGTQARWGKLAAIVLGILLLGSLLYGAVREITAPGPEGEYLTLQEAGNLTWLLLDTAGRGETEGLSGLFTQEASEEGGGMLTCRVWEQILALFPDCGYEIPDYYRKKDRVLLSDWYDFFDAARLICDGEGRIRDMDLTPIGVGSAVTDAEGRTLGEEELISAERSYTFRTERLPDSLFRPVTAVERDGVLYALRSVDGTESGISNIWIMEVEKDGLRCFWNDYELRIDVPEEELQALGAAREQVADLGFLEGRLASVHMRTDKISGRLLKIRDNGAEIEGYGYLPFAETLKIYRLHGQLKKYYITDLRIGYDFTDFVVEDGRIQAALVAKEEAMENIRVLVKTSDFGGAFHDAVELEADCDLNIRTADGGEQVLPAGERLRLDGESELFAAGRVRIEPAILTGRISLLNVARSQGIPAYRGSLELERQADGIVVINDVLLEEYLYAVVPSEMPSTYPLEALKSQAICARTYAYGKMLHAGLPSYGAHVDDSAGFQVYNNITENVETTKAVKETKGELLYYREELAEAFYYSTSCGYGTNTGIWQNSVPADFPYLQAKAVNVAGVTDAQGDAIDSEINEEDIGGAEDMTQEENFAAFIKNARPSDFESGEAWYRWTYRVEEMDAASLYENVKRRYAAAPGTVYVRQADGSFQNQEPVDPGRITDLYIAKRNAGGVAEELVIEGENAALMVKTEHNIRYILSNGTSKVVRQDGSEYQAGSLLPSAFLVIETGKEDGYVVGYTLFGGGFGHGVGLSQNGARSMAQNGCDSGNILAYFYEGSEVKKIY